MLSGLLEVWLQINGSRVIFQLGDLHLLFHCPHVVLVCLVSYHMYGEKGLKGSFHFHRHLHQMPLQRSCWGMMTETYWLKY